MVIVNGLIVDGSGGTPFMGNVRVSNGIIQAVEAIAPGDALPCPADEMRIDAAGRCITPGFVDAHRHADYAMLQDGFGAIELAQGITTMVTGACGLTPYPFAPEMRDTLAPICGDMQYEAASFGDYRDRVNTRALPINMGTMIGSCSVRAALKGMCPAPFSPAELAAAKGIVAEATTGGALGLSMGLMYKPESHSTFDELTEIAAAAARAGGRLAVHIRGEGDSLVASVQEAVRIAQKAGISLIISHFKCCGPRNWGKGLYQAIEIIEQARKNHDVTVDFYPYHGGAGTLLSLLPPDYPRALWHDAAALKTALSKEYAGWDNYTAALGFERIILNNLQKPEHKAYNGKTVAEASQNQCPYALLSAVLTGEEGRAGITVMSMSPKDVDTVAALPYASVISDALYPQILSSAHPRLFSAFPKVIRDMVIERGILTLPEAVRKMTVLPAQRMGIRKRGLLKPGYAADMLIFSPENMRDRSDFTASGLLAEGMDYVFVNGQPAWERGWLKGRHGKFIQGAFPP